MTTSPSPTKCRLSTAEAAEYAGIPANTLRYYRQLGTGPASYKLGSRVVYDLADLDSWLAAEKVKTVRGGVA
ncbi:helix-turn-helix domain-containing protein [Mycolicibacterium austroafricanum]|uniref:Helix-turn-helix domain-containing protein n=1 Tax=Mycolicibacterium austroafricanum TaxID=39687 RepID=A0ABT8HIC0_MYCAO|nr:helix-turn-helix domain-containing protein [Mycolicibacterium austroafricanum]MDN4520523.1 helix-turn-helix domain-containing protein [Mycolicibacterium austroafricanum]QRZ09404.1 helix-turn-helix domain-containing protein [Mycolicibacterium austroafricanum]QZT71056.1 helix-turn-helix domain-containing protein [Mycolicibacterium austroafricanum]